MSRSFSIRQGDRRPALAFRFGFSLAQATGVRFSLRDEATGLIFIDEAVAEIGNGTYDLNGAPVTLTPADGIAFYNWAAADTAQARRSCFGLFRVIWPGNLPETLPSEGYLKIVIHPRF